MLSEKSPIKCVIIAQTKLFENKGTQGNVKHISAMMQP